MECIAAAAADDGHCCSTSELPFTSDPPHTTRLSSLTVLLTTVFGVHCEWCLRTTVSDCIGFFAALASKVVLAEQEFEARMKNA